MFLDFYRLQQQPFGVTPDKNPRSRQSNWESPSDSEKNIQWTRTLWNALRPFLAEGSYGNYVSDEGDPFARAAYGPNYDRLVALKNKYDPTNFFRMNHNVEPVIQPGQASRIPSRLARFPSG